MNRQTETLDDFFATWLRIVTEYIASPEPHRARILLEEAAVMVFRLIPRRRRVRTVLKGKYENLMFLTSQLTSPHVEPGSIRFWAKRCWQACTYEYMQWNDAPVTFNRNSVVGVGYIRS